ncbi:MAG: uroporphyrinogen decarboxylase family protein [Rikenellaceae bacterium]
MTHKERFLATIARQTVDRPASWLGLPVPEALDSLFSYFKVSSVAELKAILNDDVYPIEVPYINPPTNDIGCALSFVKNLDELSQEERTLTAPGFFEDIDDPALVDTFPWPNPADHIDVDESMRRAKAVSPDYFRMGIMWSAHFQDACAAFGMETALIVMYTNPEMFQAVIDRIVDFYLETNEIFYEATKGELDGVLIGNDFGSQCSLLVSPDDLRRFVFPGTKRLVDQAKGYGLKVIHHSCGSVYPVIGDLFDLGVDVVHPIQALATDMNAEKLSKDFAGRGAFFGGIDAQHLLVNGKPEQIKADVERLKGLFPTGLVLSPSHEAILPDIPPANIEAIFKANRIK